MRTSGTSGTALSCREPAGVMVNSLDRFWSEKPFASLLIHPSRDMFDYDKPSLDFQCVSHEAIDQKFSAESGNQVVVLRTRNSSQNGFRSWLSPIESSVRRHHARL